jgi:UPF0271 protein
VSAPISGSIDLNADVGEGFPWDALLMGFITSANIACGGHAGDEAGIAATAALARQHGVAIGAHPGHEDREHFGRRAVPITPAAAASLVVKQISRLERVVGEPPGHVKLHGGLYHQVAREGLLAEAVTDAIAERWPAMTLLAPAESLLVNVARACGLRVGAEAFIDRAYAADGTLIARAEAEAVIADPVEAASRAMRLVLDGVVDAVDGTRLRMRADTLCIHGDGPDPVATATAVRAALDAAGVLVRAIS